jgi:hypothetical protein
MAYTPYTYSALTQENPCIAVSNDGINWTVPTGLTNPLEPYLGESSKYNSDTHLIYRSDLDRLEIWWRYVDDTAHTTMLKRKTSVDGVSWTSNENIFTGNTSTNDHMSPSVIFENGKYKMWCVANSPLRIKYYESTTGLDGSWSVGIDALINWGTINPWHMDVIHTDLGYEFIIHGYEDGGDNNHGNLYYVFSTDLINFTMPKLILKPSYRLNSFDNQGIYRSSIVKANGIYYMFYSSVSTNNTRSISLSYGVTPTALKGLDISNDQDIARFISLELMNYLYLEPASSPSATPYKAGALQYTNTVNKDGSTIQFHDGSVWRILAEKYLTSMAYIKRGTSIDITLSNGIESIITFSTRVKDYPQKWTNSNMYTAPSAGWYDVNVNFVLSTLATTSKIRVYLKINDVEALQIFEDTGNGGIKTVNTNAFIELQANDTLKVAIMLTGTDSPIIQSSKGYIHIEKKYNTIV